MHRSRSFEAPAERVAWVLDDMWPETASMVATAFGPDDELIAPGILGARLRRYEWPIQRRQMAIIATARRHWAMRRVARSTGAVRQRTYLEQDRLLARQLARAIDFRARHLVIAQAWLPWLEESGALGGRSFDVVMSRYPLGEIHRLLDEAAEELGRSATIADFRAPPDLVEREAELLARARRIYTPHRGIAALFPEQAARLEWHKPAATLRKAGNRTAFLGPTIARQRPDVARRVAMSLKEPLVVFGSMLEPMWDGIEVERRDWGPRWLDGIGAILHPATTTNEPRALLQAQAAGVVIYATETCGLDPSQYRTLDHFRKI